MLETLRMNIQTYINKYLKLASEIFPVEGLTQESKVGQFINIARGRQRFKIEPLKSTITRLVKKYLRERNIESEKTLFRFEAFKLKENRSCNVKVILFLSTLFQSIN